MVIVIGNGYGVTFLQRKYVNKTEKRQTCGRTIKQLGLLITGRDMHLMTRKQNPFNFIYTSQMYVHHVP